VAGRLRRESPVQGSGTINGSGSFGFLLTAIDGQLTGGGGTDKLRMKIWNKNAGNAIVYDNQMSAGDNSNPTTVLGGGSIVIRTSVSAAGEFQTAGVSEAPYQLSQNAPNPFNPSTMIAFEIPSETRVFLAVYDIRGRLVRVLLDEVSRAGRREVRWDGRDSAGRLVSSGVYHCKFMAGGTVLSRRMVLMK
jgi:hypothetical protein